MQKKQWTGVVSFYKEVTTPVIHEIRSVGGSSKYYVDGEDLSIFREEI